ncbi:hypothetical protein GGF31_003975 [Allomyces arbusculus]|nr:hypothetical protein GGF31_003975 [Allomyces arbusculus]
MDDPTTCDTGHERCSSSILSTDLIGAGTTRAPSAALVESPSSAAPPLRPKATWMHWIILALGCLITFGNYYCYDLPAALNVPLRAWLDVEYDVYQYYLNLLYSCYSLPNIFLPLVGGYLVDALGARRMMLTFSAIIVTGTTLFAAGVSWQSLPVMVAGRTIAGLGGESLEVAGTTITTEWFQAAGLLSMALGVNLSASRLAAAFQDVVSPWIVSMRGDMMVGNEWWIRIIAGTPLAAWVGAATCVLSAVCSLILVRLDTWELRRRYGLTVLDEDEVALLGPSSVSPSPTPSSSMTLLSDATAASTRAATPASCRADHEDMPPVRSPAKSSTVDDEERAALLREPTAGTATFVEAEASDVISWRTVLQLRTSFWILCAVTVLLYGAFMPFVHISSDFIQSKWYPGDLQTAGALMAIPDLITAFGTPIMGLIVDRFGRPGRFLPISAAGLVIAHGLLFYTSLPPHLPLILLGSASALYAAALWPCVPLLADAHQLGTAYGLVTVALNVVLATCPLLVAHIRAESDSFTPVGHLFVGVGAAAVAATTALVAWDAKDGARLAQGGTHNEDREERVRRHRTGTEDGGDALLPTRVAEGQQYGTFAADGDMGRVVECEEGAEQRLLHRRPVPSGATLVDGVDAA